MGAAPAEAMAMTAAAELSLSGSWKSLLTIDPNAGLMTTRVGVGLFESASLLSEPVIFPEL